MFTLRELASSTGYSKTSLENWVKNYRRDNPESDLGQDQGKGKAKLYSDSDIAKILAYAPKENAPIVTTGIVPSSVALATDSQLSTLDTAIERYKPKTVELNGLQEQNLERLNLLISAVDQASEINSQKQHELEQRENTLEKSEQLIDLATEKLLAEQRKNRELNRKALEISERELRVSELLGKLGVS